MKQKFGNKVALIREMFPDWSEVDILYALQETDGDENLCVTRIAEGKPLFPVLPPTQLLATMAPITCSIGLDPSIILSSH